MYDIVSNLRTHARTHACTHAPKASSCAVRKGTVVEARAVDAEAVEVEEELAVAAASVVARALQYNNTSNLLQKWP